MKTLILVLFVLSYFSLNPQVNSDSIESIMIQLIRKDRGLKGTTYLYTSERCKKVSKIHLDYTLKYLNPDTYSHDETIPFYSKKVLRSPSNRYSLFNSDSVTIKVMDDYYKKVTLWCYSAEIMTGCYVTDINEPNINKIIAEKLFIKFKNSPTHYKSMVKNPTDGQIYRGNFSISYKKEMINGVEYYTFVCVGVFDQSRYYPSETNRYKKSKESNFYFD